MAFNAFGLCRQYPRLPFFKPDRLIPSSLLADSCPTTSDAGDTQTPRLSPEPPYPFPNMTTYCLMAWMHSGSHQKSETEVSRLVKDIIQAKDFNPSDLDGFTVKRSLRALDNGGKETITFPDDWLKTDITLDIPTKSKDNQSMAFIILGFHYRPLVGIICSAFADIQANAFHLLPFKWLWRDPLSDGRQECVFDELYTSDSWLQAQDDLHRQPKEHGCSLEHIIAGLMFFSNMTHLTTFGTAKAWPLYLYFGN
ncbi:hypothetical protein BDR06DRAFT_1007925 [Suillus hirtellus]|nr:hypothetical protein BDR06DRAFT_1007925 [Suillus hirtellus]